MKFHAMGKYLIKFIRLTEWLLSEIWLNILTILLGTIAKFLESFRISIKNSLNRVIYLKHLYKKLESALIISNEVINCDLGINLIILKFHTVKGFSKQQISTEVNTLYAIIYKSF